MTVSLRTKALRTSAVLALSGLVLIHCGGDQKNAETPDNAIPSAEPPPASEADAATTRNAPSATEAAASAQAAPEPAAASTPATPAPEPLSDEQIAAVTEAANSAEIAQAKIAQTKSKDAGVKRFAAMMITHHSEAKQKQAKLKLKPQESGVSTTLQADAASTLNALKADQGKDFDKVYVTAQVDEHQKVLDTINDKLLPNAKNAELKAYLEEVKSKVEQHLGEAKKLQQNLDSKSASGSTTDQHAG